MPCGCGSGDRLVQAQEAARLLASVPASGGGSSSLADEVRALNTLTRLTESGDFELLLDYVPDLLDAIAASMDRHNAMIQPFRQRLVKQLGSGRRGSSLAAAVLSSKREQGPPLVAAGLFSSHVQPAPSTIEGQLVCGNAILLQNLSFIMGNQEAIAYHPRLLAHLASLLPLWHPSTDLGLYACTALANLSKYLDVNGMPMTVAVEDSYDAGGVPEDSLMALAPPKMRTQAATGTGGGRDPDSLDFIAIVYNIFPTLFDLLTSESLGREGGIRAEGVTEGGLVCASVCWRVVLVCLQPRTRAAACTAAWTACASSCWPMRTTERWWRATCPPRC